MADQAGVSAAVAALTALCRPQRVAIVGGSADPAKIAGRPVRYLRHAGFEGDAYLVNPGLPEVEGFQVFGTISELPAVPDVAFVALGTNGAIGAVRELAAFGTRTAIVLASDFAESGAEGAARQVELATAAGAMRLLGPNTLGVVNLTDGVLLTASDAIETPGIERGEIALASQSGGLMGSLLSRAAGRGIGFSTLIATGNEADLELADCIEYFTEDEATSVIALYIEALRNPRRFLEVARRASAAGKRIVAYKVGRSEVGARAANSHTGALAGSDRAYDALFEQAGVQRVSRFGDLLEIPGAIATGKAMRGRRVGVLTTTGGAGTLLADACGALGIDLPSLGDATARRLAALLPSGGLDAAHNPVDLTLAGTNAEVMTPVIELLAACEDFDALVVVLGSSAVARPRLVADPLIGCAAAPDAKPLFAYVGPYLPEVLDRLNRSGVPAFDAPESCAAALAAVAPPVTVAHAVPQAPTLSSASGDEVEGKELLARYGIASPRRIVSPDPADAARLSEGLTEPFAVKVVVRGLAHKSDIGGVALGVGSAQLADVACELAARVEAALPGAVDGILVEEMVSGFELLLGMVRDPALGPLILLGSGGITAELVDDTVIRLPPVNLDEAHAMIADLRLAPLLNGGRGQQPGDVKALAEAITSFSHLVEELGPALVALEINPLVVRGAGQGVVALDAIASWQTDGSAERTHS